MLTKDGKDVEVLKIDANNYKVPAGEEHLYHVKIEVKKFNPESGARMSRPRIQKFGAKEYDTTVKNDLVRQGYTLEVLHNPTEWVKQQQILNKRVADQRAAAKKQSADLTAAANLKAADAKRKAEIDAAVKQALEAQAAENQKAIDKAVAAAIAKADKKEKKAEESGK